MSFVKTKDGLERLKIDTHKINDSYEIGLLIQQFYSYDFHKHILFSYNKKFRTTQNHWVAIFNRMGIWSGLFI